MIFTIKEGKHTSFPRFPIPFFSNELHFTVRFNESAKYDPIITDYDHSYDVNKVFGFMEGFSDFNSARLGWSYTGGGLILYPYVHVNGEVWMKQSIPPICPAEFDRDIRVSIIGGEENYMFKVDNNLAFAPRAEKSWVRFLQFPYFGGENTAPHKININIKK